jgi:hypothetical protein
VSTAEDAVVTVDVVTVNVADVLPALTVTEEGTAATVELLDKLILAPPVGAADDSVTVPVEEVPPVTEVGFRLMDVRVAGGAVILSAAVTLALL